MKNTPENNSKKVPNTITKLPVIGPISKCKIFSNDPKIVIIIPKMKSTIICLFFINHLF